MAYEIDISAPALDKFLDKLDSAVDKIAEVKQSVKALGREAGEAQSAARNTAPQLTGGARSPVMPYTRGPRAGLDRATRELDFARQSKDAKLIRDAEDRVARAQESVRRSEQRLNPQPKSQSDAIWDAIMTSRIGPGGRLYPLVNKLRSAGLTSSDDLAGKLGDMGMNPATAAKVAPVAANIAKAMLPATLAAVGIAAVGYGAYALANNTSDQIGRFGNSRVWSGATFGQIGQMQALGGDNAGERAYQFSQRLREGGFGAAYMRSKGIIDNGPYTLNKGKNYLAAIDALSDPKISDEQAAVYDRELGLTDELAKYRYLSDDSYARVKKSVAPPNREDMKAQAEYEAQKTTLVNGWNNFWREFGTQAMRGINNTFDADYWLGNPLSPEWQEKHLGIAKGDGKRQHKAEKADNTVTYGRQARDESIGMGGRSSSAFPVGLRGVQLSNAIESDAIALGAFSVG